MDWEAEQKAAGDEAFDASIGFDTTGMSQQQIRAAALRNIRAGTQKQLDQARELSDEDREKFNKQYPSVFQTDPAKAQGSLLGIQARDANAKYDAAVRTSAAANAKYDAAVKKRAAADAEVQKFKDPNTLGPLSPEKPEPNSQFNTANEAPPESVMKADEQRRVKEKLDSEVASFIEKNKQRKAAHLASVKKFKASIQPKPQVSTQEDIDAMREKSTDEWLDKMRAASKI
jgi:hypothetical protein